jgi:glutamate-1-semialdehyde aminotransferase
VALAQGIDRNRLRALTEREHARLVADRPRSAELLGRASGSMPRGVPMAWMTQLFGHPPIFIDRGAGASFVDVDGRRSAHDAELYRLLRLFMVNRGVWEAMEWAGPAFSVAATDPDVDVYLGVLGELLGELAA